MDLISASYAGEHRHRQEVIEERFPDAFNFVPQSIADCWLFNVPAPLPPGTPEYFEDIGDDEATP